VSSRRDRISFWDALILTAAAVAGCPGWKDLPT
jgi:predicted nucleic acid-binding protein